MSKPTEGGTRAGRVHCARCGAGLKLTAAQYGKRLTCPLCGQRLMFTAPRQDAAPPAASPHPNWSHVERVLPVGTRPDQVAAAARGEYPVSPAPPPLRPPPLVIPEPPRVAPQPAHSRSAAEAERLSAVGLLSTEPRQRRPPHAPGLASRFDLWFLDYLASTFKFVGGGLFLCSTVGVFLLVFVGCVQGAAAESAGWLNMLGGALLASLLASFFGGLSALIPAAMLYGLGELFRRAWASRAAPPKERPPES